MEKKGKSHVGVIIWITTSNADWSAPLGWCQWGNEAKQKKKMTRMKLNAKIDGKLVCGGSGMSSLTRAAPMNIPSAEW